jgi:hypothetical protein
MKAPKILLAGLLALSSAGIAPAQTVVHITGSTAFRNATVAGIVNILKPGFTYGYVGSSFSGANQQIFNGTAVTASGNIPCLIKTSWTGAAGGIQTVVQQDNISTWLTNIPSYESVSGVSIPSSPTPSYDPPTPPDVSMDDGIQATTPLPNCTSPVLTVQNVGAVTFQFVKNVGAPAGLTNMTPLLAQALWANGSLPLSMWTGKPTDTSLVYATGRDPDSGTRKVTFLETGIQNYVTGVTPSTVLQYEPTNGSGQVNRNNTGTITGVTPWPVDTVDGVTFDVGDAGYSSGGDLAQAMKTATSPSLTFVTYLGLADATTAITGGATSLTWNGVAYSDAGIENGQYTFWAYEQLGYLPTYGTTSANGKAVADALAQNIINIVANQGGEFLSTMNVTRSQEGAPVTP